jgi:hypothetical protein
MCDVQRVLRVCVIEASMSWWMWCWLADRQFMKPWIRRSEHWMSVRRCVCPTCRPISMPASSARLMVCEGGVEVARILTNVSEAGWVAVALGGRSLLF